MYELLKKAGVPQDVIGKACEIVEELAINAERECPQCLERFAKDQEKLEESGDLDLYDDSFEENSR